ncbi:hypothetical protein [Leptospira santarosai]|uniref:hypothetical protein n=1 Tax=Leptospira santarosai TaxID=28183 RepID=UPI000628606C
MGTGFAKVRIIYFLCGRAFLIFPFAFQKAEYNIHCNYILKNRNVIFTNFKRELSVHNSESFQVRLFLGFPKKDRLFQREVSDYLSDGI